MNILLFRFVFLLARLLLSLTVMKLAIPIHGDRISSVFDVARKFGFFIVSRENEIVGEEFSIAETDPLDKTRQIVENGSDVLICGAISWPLELTLISTGVVVIPNTCGMTVEVINAFLAGGFDEKAFLMPGCTGQRRCRGCCAVRGFTAPRGSSSGRTDGRYRRRNIKQLKEKKMKVAVTATKPDLNGALDPRFGRCAYFMIVDPEDMSFEAVVNPNVSLGGGAGIQSAQLMAQKGVKAVLTGNCGPNAHKTLTAAGVDVIIGMSGTISEAVEQYQKGGLKAAGGPNVEDHSGMKGGGHAGQSSKQPTGQPVGQNSGQPSNPSAGGPMGGQGAGLGRGGGGGMGRGGGGGGQGMGRGGGQGMGRGGGQGMGRGGGRGGGQGVDRGGGRGRGGGGRR